MRRRATISLRPGARALGAEGDAFGARSPECEETLFESLPHRFRGIQEPGLAAHAIPAVGRLAGLGG